MRNLVYNRPRTVIWGILATGIAVELLIGTLAIRNGVNPVAVVVGTAIFIGLLIVTGALAHRDINRLERELS